MLASKYAQDLNYILMHTNKLIIMFNSNSLPINHRSYFLFLRARFRHVSITQLGPKVRQAIRIHLIIYWKSAESKKRVKILLCYLLAVYYMLSAPYSHWVSIIQSKHMIITKYIFNVIKDLFYFQANFT